MSGKQVATDTATTIFVNIFWSFNSQLRPSVKRLMKLACRAWFRTEVNTAAAAERFSYSILGWGFNSWFTYLP
jgi:hypothetical protein